MRSDALKFANERYFNRYSDTRSVQENFNLITSFIQDSKTSRSVSSVPWITPAIRRKIRRKMQLMQKQKSQVVQKSEQNLKLFEERSKLISGSNMIFM